MNITNVLFADKYHGLHWSTSLSIAILDLTFIIFTTPIITVSIRRLHDIGLSGCYCLLSFIPFVGFYVLYLFTQDSQYNINEYGISPKYISIQNVPLIPNIQFAQVNGTPVYNSPLIPGYPQAPYQQYPSNNQYPSKNEISQNTPNIQYPPNNQYPSKDEIIHDTPNIQYSSNNNYPPNNNYPTNIQYPSNYEKPTYTEYNKVETQKGTDLNDAPPVPVYPSGQGGL